MLSYCVQGIDWGVILFVWIYVLLWSIVQDAGKVLNNKLLAYCGMIEDLGVICEEELAGQQAAEHLLSALVRRAV